MHSVKKTAALLIAAVLLCAAGCRSGRSVMPAGSEVTVFVAGDLHYLSPSLTDCNDDFMALFAAGDGKMTPYSPQIVSAFLWQVKTELPDYLIICGDITYNGAEASHEDMAMMLRQVEQSGVEVLVIPGNHDISNYFARSFFNGGSASVSYITKERFRELYGDFGYNEALARDESSFSYLYALKSDLYLLAVDVGIGGVFSNELREWTEEQLKRAKADGAEVIAVTHYNVITHNEMFNEGYTMVRNDALIDLFEQYDVRLNLSGHLHIQDIACKNGICDVATGALCVNPMAYGILSAGAGNSLTYTVAATDVDAYAEEYSLAGGEIPAGFAAFAENYFDSCSAAKVEAMLSEARIPADAADDMAQCAVEANRYYFAGTLGSHAEELRSGQGWQLWQSRGSSLRWYEYLSGMLENAADETYLFIP